MGLEKGAEIYAIRACVMENIRVERGYIYILSNSQAAIKTLDSFQINSKLVWDCHQSLVKLADHNRFQLVWVPEHMGIDGNEIADLLARQGSSHPFIGPEPALGISAKAAREVIKYWTSRKHEEHWQSIHRQRQAKGFLKKPSANKPGESLSLSGDKPRIMTELLTRHCHLKGHLFNLRLVNSPECDASRHLKWLHMFFVTVRLRPH
jgi:hypothetical protein